MSDFVKHLEKNNSVKQLAEQYELLHIFKTKLEDKLNNFSVEWVVQWLDEHASKWRTTLDEPSLTANDAKNVIKEMRRRGAGDKLRIIKLTYKKELFDEEIEE